VLVVRFVVRLWSDSNPAASRRVGGLLGYCGHPDLSVTPASSAARRRRIFMINFEQSACTLSG
jgi:hypothetical protein